MASETLYKVLGPGGEAVYGGKGHWSLPIGIHEPGRWMPIIANPRCCERGYHLVTREALIEWVRYDMTLYEAEGRGPSHTDGSGKTAYAEARLLRQIPVTESQLRLWAADCAERVLDVFECRFPDDNRPRHCIETVRSFARGEVTREQMTEAARAAGAAGRGWGEEHGPVRRPREGVAQP